MRFTWPPSSQNGWDIQSFSQEKKENNTFFLPLQKSSHMLLAIQIRTSESRVSLEIPVGNTKSFLIEIPSNEWTFLPYPIEQHAIGAVWESLDISLDTYILDLAYFPWTARQFRMRALVDSEGSVLFAYRVSKKGATVAYFPPKDHTMTLPEDAYIIHPTYLLNDKSILLVSAQSKIEVKKIPECRYFSL